MVSMILTLMYPLLFKKSTALASDLPLHLFCFQSKRHDFFHQKARSFCRQSKCRWCGNDVTDPMLPMLWNMTMYTSHYWTHRNERMSNTRLAKPLIKANWFAFPRILKVVVTRYPNRLCKYPIPISLLWCLPMYLVFSDVTCTPVVDAGLCDNQDIKSSEDACSNTNNKWRKISSNKIPL